MRDENNDTICGYEIFSILQNELIKNLPIKYKQNWDLIDIDVIKKEFEAITRRLNNGHAYYEIFTYFEIYSTLFELMDKASIDQEQKNFFWSLIRRSSTASEQITLFYLAPIWTRLYNSLEKSTIFISFSPQNIEGFALKFYNKNHFYTEEWSKFYESQQDPA
ncbi:MAG: hypothetical protein RIQ74_449 [Pseudomonadota bacterium]